MMIEIPSLVRPTILELLIIPMTIVLTYAAHEMLHLIAYFIFRVNFEFEIAPNREEKGLFYCLTWGQAVSIKSVDPVPNWFIVIQAMMPILLFIPALLTWLIVLSKPVVSIGLLINVALFAMISLPSPIDWAVAHKALKNEEAGIPG